MTNYTRITHDERDRIVLLIQQGNNQKQIAVALGKNQSSISRELRKGAKSNGYSPQTASFRTDVRAMKRKPKLRINQGTLDVIKNHLGLHWSPRQIAFYLTTLDKNGIVRRVCEKTIYNYLHFHLRGELKKLALAELRLKGKKRSSPLEKRGKIPNMTLIDERPAEVQGRLIPGHWEGDLIIGKDHQSALSVIIERTTRYVMIDRLVSYDAESVRTSIERRLKTFSSDLVKSITCDQGKEMAQHEKLAAKMKMKVYFCHPHSPWEKGTCENTNYLIRDMLDLY